MFKAAVKRSSSNQKLGAKRRVAASNSAVVIAAPRSDDSASDDGVDGDLLLPSGDSVRARESDTVLSSSNSGTIIDRPVATPPALLSSSPPGRNGAVIESLASPGINRERFVANSPPGRNGALIESPASPGINRERFVANSPPGRNGALIESPASPGSNRERFMANFQPMKVCCDLSVAGLHNSSTRFSFQAVVLIVYPATMKPERRHLLLIDSRGCAGITVWNENVSLFSASSVGQVVKFTKLSLTSQNGQKSLSMSRDSTVNFVSTAVAACEESKWWSSLLDKRPLRIIDVHDQDENSMISVSGIVGTLSSEIKRVKNEDKVLMCMRITDRTGFVDVRSWNHSEAEFDSFREKPILLKRVRVTAYAGTKMIELLDASGTHVLSDFDGAPDLVSYWSE